MPGDMISSKAREYRESHTSGIIAKNVENWYFYDLEA